MKAAEAQLEERTQSLRAELEGLAEREAEARIRAEAGRRELADAHQQVNELTQKLSRREQKRVSEEARRRAKSDTERIASVEQGFEHRFAEAEAQFGKRAEELRGKLEQATRREEEMLRRAGEAERQLSAERTHREQDKLLHAEAMQRIEQLTGAADAMEGGTGARARGPGPDGEGVTAPLRGAGVACKGRRGAGRTGGARRAPSSR